MAGPMLAPLVGASLWRFSGPDARRLLNGLITTNVRDLAVGAVAGTALCDVKGRVQGLGEVWSLADDTIGLLLDGVDPDWFEPRFERFIVFDDAELSRLDAPGALHTLQGPGAAAALQAAGLPAPEGLAAHGDAVIARSDRGPWPGFDLFDPSGGLRARLAVPMAGPHALDRLRVAVGRPAWPDDIGDKELPHHAGLRARCLHFEKGCYVGQEVIHRMEAMGRARKDLVAVALDAPAPAGAELVADGKVGRLGRVVPWPAGGWVALAVVRLEHSAPGTALAVGDGERVATATVLHLPLALPEFVG